MEYRFGGLAFQRFRVWRNVLQVSLSFKHLTWAWAVAVKNPEVSGLVCRETLRGSKLIPVCVVLAAAVVASGCGRAAPLSAPAEEVPSRHQVVVQDVVLMRFQNDTGTERVSFRTGRLDRMSGIVEARGVEAVVFPSDSSPPDEGLVRIRGPEARVFLRSRVLEFSRKITLRDGLGRRLSAASARYDAQRDWLEIPTKVTLEGDNFFAEGLSLKGHPRGGKLEVAGPLRARFGRAGRR